MPPPPAHQLDYGQRPHPWIRKRQAVWLGGAILIALTIWKAPKVWDQVGYLYLQHECLTYIGPDSQVVYDERPSSMPRPGPVQRWWGGGKIGNHVFDADPAPPPPWRRFPMSRARDGVAVLFSHERISPLGHRRLVVVDLRLYRPRLDLLLRVPMATVIVPAGLTGEAGLVGINGQFINSPGFDYDDAEKGLRFYAGQPDPADASHFTIKFEMGGRTGVIDGWLGDDNGVRMELRIPTKSIN